MSTANDQQSSVLPRTRGHMPSACEHTLPTLFTDTHSTSTAAYHFPEKSLYHQQPEEIMASWTFKIHFIYFSFHWWPVLLPSPFPSVLWQTGQGLRGFWDWKPYITGLFSSPIPKFYFLSLFMSWLHGKAVRDWISSEGEVFPSSHSHQKALNLSSSAVWPLGDSKVQSLRVIYKASASGNQTRNLCKTWWLWYGEM